MPSKAKTPCKQPGCPVLMDVPGYCTEHQRNKSNRDGFKTLDTRKTTESKKFYSSAAWTAASKRHRKKEPLCRRCKQEGKIVVGQMVHHNPEREVLIAQGKSPFDDIYLETLCNNCHLAELRNRRKK